MKRKLIAMAALLAILSLGATPAAADTTTVETSFALSGQSAEKVFFDKLIHCDDCAPDDLFRCGGCEITAGIRLRPTARVLYSTQAEIESTYSDDSLSQGGSVPMSHELSTSGGVLKLVYSLHYVAGLFGKGGNFPSDWSRSSEYSIDDTISKELLTSCALPTSGTSTCTVNVPFPILDEECFFTACAVDITVSLVFTHVITLSPTGVVAQRISSFQPSGSLNFAGAQPITVNDAVAVPCDAPVGSTATYNLSGLGTGNIPVDLDGQLSLDYYIDGPGPANHGDTVPLTNTFDLWETGLALSSATSIPLTLGTVDADAAAPVLSDVSIGPDVTEGGTIAVSADADDNCRVGARINWGDGSPEQVVPVSGTHRDLSFSHAYGDDGTFTIQLCALDGVGSDCESVSRTIGNASPSTAIDGPASILARAGDTLSFTTRTTDPGSDDITHSWDFGDGSAPGTSISLVNAPLADGDPSTSVQPRDLTDTRSHLFGDACTYTTTVTATDDDGGSVADSVEIVITGNATTTSGAGWWYQRFTEPVGLFSPTRLNCYLGMVGDWSTVLDEVVDASTISKAGTVLDLNQPGGSTAQFDRQLLATWLNVANGGLTFGKMVDTNKDKVADSTVEQVIQNAEAARHMPGANADSLSSHKDLLEKMNLGKI